MAIKSPIWRNLAHLTEQTARMFWLQAQYLTASLRINSRVSHLTKQIQCYQKTMWRFELSNNEKIRRIGHFAKNLIYSF